MQKRMKFTVGIGIIILSLGWLGWLGARESKTYYHTITELQSLEGSARTHRMRVGGTVKTGSIQRLTGRVDFILLEEGKSLPVSYVGTDPLPDTFVDNSQALIEGKVMSDGRFVAERVQAKCASKYEPAPAQNGTPAKSGSYSNN